MKKPEQVLLEVVSGDVKCFRKHTHDTWKDFTSCCKVEKTRLVGTHACYWILLEGKLSAHELRELKAIHYIEPRWMDGVMASHGLRLSKKIEDRVKHFFSPRNLVKYSSRKEIAREFPDISDVVFDVPNDVVSQMRRIHERYKITLVKKVKIKSVRHSVHVEFMGVRRTIMATKSQMENYFRTLLGREDVSSCWVGEKEDRRLNMDMHSLTSCKPLIPDESQIELAFADTF